MMFLYPQANKKGLPAGRRGFTLIELMVVIAIIGILASIITVSLQTSRAKGRDAKRVADIRTIQLALEEFYNDNGYYPGVNLYSGTGSISPTYIASVPKDPKDNATQYFYSPYKTGGGPNCLVGSVSEGVKYHLAAAMESDNSSNPALNQDVDAAAQGVVSCSGTTADFNGNAAACSGTTAQAGGVDNCYDQTN